LRIATYWWGGRRHVGRLSADGKDVVPLALGARARTAGALALVEAMAAGAPPPKPAGGITLAPGDIIATGTPSGVGIGLDPPKYLKRGDRVRIEIDGIGVLENPAH